MNDVPLLAEHFEAHRSHLRSVAYRMLGSTAEADDAVQESWIRLSKAGTEEVENLGGWMTTIVARVCLDVLRSRRSRREHSLDETRIDSPSSQADSFDPEHQAVMADSVGLAMLVVLETLQPTERLAFVLHDMFSVPFEEIAPIVGRTPAATRQIASRARRRVQGTTTPPDPDKVRQREMVDAFLAASREGNFEALLAVLDPGVVLRADVVAAAMGANSEVRGIAEVAKFFTGKAQAARRAEIDGVAGAVWAPGGTPKVAFVFKFVDGKIASIDLVADPADLDAFDLEILGPK